ncbi:MAG: electron transfer flavoprotein subunit alpha/FixB family protein [Thermomicrobiales bacterium]|nr:electron transfer flavoprotein subunit alpha/FixB family protein [Thermomicrobiales bacterium]
MANTILVLAETSEGSLKPVSLEAANAAIQLATATGGQVVAGVLSNAPGEAAGLLASTSVSRVLTVTDDALASFTTDAFVAAAQALCAAVQPALVLIPATTSGRDYAPALAATLSAVSAADATEITASGDGYAAVRPVYGGKMLSRVDLPAGKLAIVTLRPGSYEKAATNPDAAPIEAIDAAIPAPRVRVEGLLQDAGGGSVKLEEAEVIVSGGRGLKEPQNFAVVEQLAEALNGVVGASRAVVDAGWRKHHEQVGQTGRTVSPRLYVAVGISGAVQHVVGMQGSEYIVAINRDPDAPIFKIASFGIVGDLFEVVPAVVDALNASA